MLGKTPRPYYVAARRGPTPSDEDVIVGVFPTKCWAQQAGAMAAKETGYQAVEPWPIPVYESLRDYEAEREKAAIEAERQLALAKLTPRDREVLGL